MKKLLSLLLCLLLCISLFACKADDVQRTTKDTSATTSDTNTDEEERFVSRIVNDDGVNRVCIEDNNSKVVEYTSSVNNTEIKALFNYLNNLKLKRRDDAGKGAISIIFSFEYGDGKTFGIVAKESQIGMFEKDSSNISVWYDIVFQDNTIGPVAFFEKIYQQYQDKSIVEQRITLEVVNERIKIPEKKIKHLKIYKDGSFEENSGGASIVYDYEGKIKAIKSFMEELELHNIVALEDLPLTGVRVCKVEIHFDDNSYAEFGLWPNEKHERNGVIGINNIYYDISKQSTELTKLLDFPW